MGIATTRIMWAARNDNGDLGLFPERPNSGNFDDTIWGLDGSPHPDRIAISDDFPGFDYIGSGKMHRVEITIVDITDSEDNG